MARWSVGRATLLGDACHAMLPFMAQGAAQAIEDGATVAVCLSGIDVRDVPDALRRYEALRLPRTSRVQGLSDANKTRFHLPDGAAQEARDAEMARGATDWSVKAVAWLYGYNAGEPERTSALPLMEADHATTERDRCTTVTSGTNARPAPKS